MLTPGQQIELAVERPAAGGRMIARHEGQIVLVHGAIPEERVTARIDRVEKRLALATTTAVLSASPDRRAEIGDQLCGGCAYAHIAYTRQLRLKAEVVSDAFLRLGRIPLDGPVAVAGSPERGYRLRARLHVRDGHPGFYREGTHTLCDARATQQLSDDTMDAIERAVDVLVSSGAAPVSLEVTEDIPGSQRAVFVEFEAGGRIGDTTLASLLEGDALTGCVTRGPDGGRLTAGSPLVGDSLRLLTRGRASAGQLQRHPESFFQANRFLLPDLVVAVLESVPERGDVLDLYAGVGLFSVALAATGRSGIVAVEGDRSSGTDLQRNAAPFAPAVRVVAGRVEDYVRQRVRQPATIVVDPPRTGMSREAMGAITGLGARRITYVSCDPPTLARDARRLLDAGYRLDSLRGFDLFPNTPHVECVALFAQAPGTVSDG